MKIAKFDALLQTLDDAGQAQAAQTFADTNSLWVKFIFTDDQPNGNKQAIAQDQYEGIIQTGVHKPFKRALGSDLSPQHDLVVPIGTVVEMSQEANQIVGLAAVWEPEFPEEAAAIRKAHADGEHLNVSWEVFYSDSSVDDSGVEWLQGVKTRAVALVGKPAYDGRTPVLAVASKWSTQYVNDLPDSSFLYIESGGSKDSDGKTTPRSLRHLPYKDKEGNVDLEHLRNAIARAPQVKGISTQKATELQNKARRILAKHDKKGESSMDLEKALERVDKLEGEKAELESSLAEAKASIEELLALKTEVEELRQYKTEVEDERTRNALIQKRMQQFSEAGLEMTSDEFEAQADKWLGMDDEAFAFVLSQLVSQKPKGDSKGEASLSDGESEPKSDDPKALVRQFLEERNRAPEQEEK